MAIVPVSKYYRSPYPHEDRVRNGKRPDWRTPGGVIVRTNFVLARMRKLVFCHSLRPDSIPQMNTGTTTTQWRWLCRTGESYEGGNTIKLMARATVLPTHSVGGTDRRWRFSAGASNSGWRAVAPLAASPTWADTTVQTAQITGLTPNTEYECSVTVEDGVRLVSLAVWEVPSTYVDTAGSYVSDRGIGYYEEGPITDAQHAEFAVTDPHTIWKHNGAHLFNLVPDDPASPWTRTGAYVNLLDAAASTTVDTNTPGVDCGVQYHDPAHSSNVACVFGVHGASTTNTGDVILVDSGGTLGTLSNFTSGGEWKSVAVNLDGSGTHKVDVQFRDLSGTLTVNAVSLFEYVA